ncbi:hypothetical protein ACMDB5_14525 [Flavobacterium sp. W1B]|uniref:hypothetical protein n=1 Tax=Flavobacterium sp. W1B TaxID=3394146 RepID=UPI0039BD914E
MEAKIGSTKKKVVYKSLVFFTLHGSIYLLFRTLKLRARMKGYLKSKKIISIDLFINFLEKTSKNIDSPHLKAEKQRKKNQLSIPLTLIRREFYYINSSHFLTI